MDGELAVAITEMDAQRLRHWLHNGGDLNAVDRWGRTALHLAAEWGFAEGVAILLDAGANPDALDEEGLTPLETALMPEPNDAVPILQSLENRRRLAALAGRTGAKKPPIF